MSLHGKEPWPLDKARAALLVIDMQSDFVDEGAVMEVAMARHRIPVMRQVIDLCRAHGVPVIYTQHVLSDHFDISPLETAYQPRLKAKGMREGSAGTEIVAELAPLPGEVIIKKHRYDAFHNTQLETVLRNIRGAGQVDTVIIIGTVTSICCESTPAAPSCATTKWLSSATPMAGWTRHRTMPRSLSSARCSGA